MRRCWRFSGGENRRGVVASLRGFRADAAEIVQAAVMMAKENPSCGYTRIAVMCRREGTAVTNGRAYRNMREYGLVRRRPRERELYQPAKLFELLGQKPNDLWQMDVTYIHIPGYGWWYAVVVID